MPMSPKEALEVAKKETARRIAGARERLRRTTLEHTIVRKGTGVTTAAIYGSMNRMGVPVEIAGFPWKVAVATLAQLGEGLSSGYTQAVFAGVADSTTAIYIERALSTDTLIAGEDDDEYIDAESEDDDGGTL